MPGTINFLNWQPQPGGDFLASHTIDFSATPDVWTVLLRGSYGSYLNIRAMAVEINVSGSNAIRLSVDGASAVYYPGASVMLNLDGRANTITIEGYGVDSTTVLFYSTPQVPRTVSMFRPASVPRASQLVDADPVFLEYSGIAATPYQWSATNIAPFNAGLATDGVLVLPGDVNRVLLMFGGDLNNPAGSAKFFIKWGTTALEATSGVNQIQPGEIFCNAPLLTQPLYLALRYTLGIDPAPGVFAPYNAGYLMAEHWLA